MQRGVHIAVDEHRFRLTTRRETGLNHDTSALVLAVVVPPPGTACVVPVGAKPVRAVEGKATLVGKNHAPPPTLTFHFHLPPPLESLVALVGSELWNHRHPTPDNVGFSSKKLLNRMYSDHRRLSVAKLLGRKLACLGTVQK